MLYVPDRAVAVHLVRAGIDQRVDRLALRTRSEGAVCCGSPSIAGPPWPTRRACQSDRRHPEPHETNCRCRPRPHRRVGLGDSRGRRLDRRLLRALRGAAGGRRGWLRAPLCAFGASVHSAPAGLTHRSRRQRSRGAPRRRRLTSIQRGERRHWRWPLGRRNRCPRSRGQVGCLRRHS